MSMRTFTRGLCVAVVLVACVAGSAYAQMDRRTFFTFRNPTAVPGVTLPPGEYVFRVADLTTPNVVEVQSTDGQTSYGLFFALSVWRLDPTDDSVLTFMETAPGMPPAVKTWFYPGEGSGRQFVYPAEQARRLTHGTHQRVPVTNLMPGEGGKPDFGWIVPEGVNDEHGVGAQPTAPAADEIGVTSVPMPEPATAPEIGPATAPRRELPQTDSATTTRVLWGALLLAAAMLVRRVRLAHR